MMADFLLELRSEEIPARMQAKARDDLARLFAAELAKAGIVASDVKTYATPRRLALIATGLPLQTAAVSEEFKGPRTSAPPQALDGFLRKTGLTQDQLEDRDGIWFATVERPGRATAEVLAEAIPAIIRAFPWPKSMRWGEASSTTESLRWVRPMQGIVALLGGDVVAVAVDGIASGRTTRRHRFHSSGDVSIADAAGYAAALRDAHVIVDQDERAGIIRDRALALCAERGLTWIADEALVAENAGLTEWPVPLLGDFDPAFLEVPPEVIRLTLATNQKYFVCADGEGKLAPAFICTANIEAKDGGAAIISGNRKVLAARLSDARFFWEQDKKTPLEVHADKLSRITFHEKLGTVADKVERVAKLARWLVEEGIIPLPAGEGRGPLADASGKGEGDAPAADRPHPSAPTALPPSPDGRGALADLAEQAARLCKADLVTEMVGEFPELQGIMGGYYARAEGLDAKVADAIRDHYKPVGQGDDVPTAPVTLAVSLADKLDTLFGFFAVGEAPTGSRDPYALRRASLAIISLLTHNNLRLPYFRVMFPAISELGVAMGRLRANEIRRALVDLGASQFVDSETLEQQFDDAIAQQNPDQNAEIAALYGLIMATPQKVADFLADRLKVQQREAGVRHDLIDAVFALGGEDDLVRLLARVHALQAFVGTVDGLNLLAGYKRAANILKKEGIEPLPFRGGVGVGSVPIEQGQSTEPTPSPSPEGEGGFSHEPAEAALMAALDAAEPRAIAAVDAEDFAGAMAALATLREPIDQFFENVTVNDADPVKRAARLSLLGRFRNAVHRVADFSKIEG